MKLMLSSICAFIITFTGICYSTLIDSNEYTFIGSFQDASGKPLDSGTIFLSFDSLDKEVRIDLSFPTNGTFTLKGDQERIEDLTSEIEYPIAFISYVEPTQNENVSRLLTRKKYDLEQNKRWGEWWGCWRPRFEFTQNVGKLVANP